MKCKEPDCAKEAMGRLRFCSYAHYYRMQGLNFPKEQSNEPT